MSCRAHEESVPQEFKNGLEKTEKVFTTPATATTTTTVSSAFDTTTFQYSTIEPILRVTICSSFLNVGHLVVVGVI